ncbi:HWE histidine kinase domain-containing protein [uncultured Caulobacter sp.]|uniref:HWE histidine kinase domain-containing protein n=1 Tax=uncultured Caulobacter sp. TaxID=158749 RepID=UPI00260CADE7|nr:HWE histidine kinase domain-containing protein [uncultured Caulobacter sp.]
MRGDGQADASARLARLEAAFADEVRKSETLARVTEAVASSTDIESCVQVVIDGAREISGAAFGAFFYNQLEPDGESYALYRLSGAAPEAFANFPKVRKTPLFAPTFENTGVVRSDDITQDPRYGLNAPRRGMPEGHLPVRSYLALPVATRQGEVLGGLFFGHPLPGRFTARDEILLVGLGGQVAATIESIRLTAGAIAELDERRRAEERLKFALDAGRMGSWDLDVATKAYEASDLCKANYGRGPDEPFSFADLIATIHPEDRPGVLTAIEAAIREGADYDVEYRVIHPTGDLRWLHARGRAAQKADDGGVRRLAGVSLDITERKRAEERQKLLVNELNHRVKNSLATVQSIAAQTLRSISSPEFFREAFETRLIALSQTHDLLTRESWAGASLREVFDVELHALAGEDRIGFDYMADIRLTPKAAVALGMGIHELATNAAKYGALSTPTGHIAVRWRAEGGLLRLIWKETGGPPVAPPSRRGFGARLLERGLAAELSGGVELTYDELGLVCEMALPLRALEP